MIVNALALQLRTQSYW